MPTSAIGDSLFGLVESRPGGARGTRLEPLGLASPGRATAARTGRSGCRTDGSAVVRKFPAPRSGSGWSAEPAGPPVAAAGAAPPPRSGRAAAEVAELDRLAAAVPGCGKAQPGAVQELALEAQQRRARRRRGRRRPGARWPRSGPGSGACGRSRAGPGRACSPSRTRSTSKWVRASRGLSVRVGHAGAPAHVAAERRVDRPAPRAGPALAPAPGTRARPRAARISSRSRRCDLLALGDQHQPGGVPVEAVHDVRLPSAAGPRRRAARPASCRGGRAPGARPARPACRRPAGRSSSQRDRAARRRRRRPAGGLARGRRSTRSPP